MTFDEWWEVAGGGEYESCERAWNYSRKDSMNKEDHLEILKLLAALESWSFSMDKRMPDWLHENLTTIVEQLTKEVLK